VERASALAATSDMIHQTHTAREKGPRILVILYFAKRRDDPGAMLHSLVAGGRGGTSIAGPKRLQRVVTDSLKEAWVLV